MTTRFPGLAGSAAGFASCARLFAGSAACISTFFDGHASVTGRVMRGSGCDGVLIVGAGRVRSTESARVPLGLGAARTLSAGVTAEADRALTRKTCRITAGEQRGRVEVR